MSNIQKELNWMKEEWAKDHKLQKFFPIPYSRKEVFRWFFNHVFGPSKRYKKRTKFIRHDETLNEITPEFRVGFVGDIMKMFEYDLEFDNSVRDFFKDAELIVGNLEGILTNQPGWVNAQRHNDEIIEELSAIKPSNQWLLCLSNNHSGDFGIADFSFHLYRLQLYGFNVFGMRDIPNFLYRNKLNFVSGTMWTNQNRCKYVSFFDEIESAINPNKFNILYPHWNYEYELYPRPKIIRICEELMETWDLIVGHHPHVVQPITCVNKSGIKKLLAYSAGNFTSGLPRKAHRYGLIMKCEIGPLKTDPSRFAVGNVNWRFTESISDEITKHIKYLRFRNYVLKPEDSDKLCVKIVDKNKFFPKIRYLNLNLL